MTTHLDVAIVGGGPTGLLLGNLLGRRGVRTAIFERQASPYDLPRAVHFDGEAMRVFQSAGLADAITSITDIGLGMRFVDPAGKILVDWSRQQDIGPMGWHESYRFHQPDLETVLRDGLNRFAHVTLHWGASVVGLTNGSLAELTLADGQRVAARFVVACDGAGSGLRSLMGIVQEDLGFEEDWLVLDVELEGIDGDRPDLGRHTVQFCDPENPGTYACGTGNRRRWEFRLEAGEQVDPSDTASHWARLSRWVGPDDARLARAAIYTFRSRLANEWQRGRVFLAGDAAHQMPPFMGQGLCAGVRDAANLAWKLSRRITQGPRANGLLATYGTERRANAHAFITRSVALGQLINRTMTTGVPEGRMRSIWPELGPGLGPRDGVAGALVPQPGCPDARADTRAGHDVYVLSRQPMDMPVPVPVIVGAEDWLEDRGLLGVVVRPDGYALGGFAAETEIAAILSCLEPDVPAHGCDTDM